MKANSPSIVFDRNTPTFSRPPRGRRVRVAASAKAVFGGLLMFLSLPAFAQEITAVIGNGVVSWTNGLTNGIYEVQWAPSLETGVVWRTDWIPLQSIQGTQAVFQASVPMFYRVKAASYPETIDSGECYTRYSNALLNAAVALPGEICTRLRPVLTNTAGTEWRTFTNWTDGTVSPWVRVATLKFTGSWAWNNLLTPGAHTMSNGYGAEFWITLYPDLRELLTTYRGVNRTLRMEKALGLPPRTGDYAVAEFYVDPRYLFRPAPNPDIRSPAGGLVAEGTAPYLAPNPLQGISPGYAAWFNRTYDTRGYAATNLDNGWPWTRLGYTFDYENCPNGPVGLSEYVVPNCSDTNYWGTTLVIPIYVDSTHPAATYGL